MEPIYSEGDWIVVRGETAKHKYIAGEYFFVWVGEAPLDKEFIMAAYVLDDEKMKPLYTGYSVVFHHEPSPGFVVQTQPAWDFETPAQAQAALEKVLWEVNRISRL